MERYPSGSYRHDDWSPFDGGEAYPIYHNSLLGGDLATQHLSIKDYPNSLYYRAR